jgi:hypothetical protein
LAHRLRKNHYQSFKRKTASTLAFAGVSWSSRCSSDSCPVSESQERPRSVGQASAYRCRDTWRVFCGRCRGVLRPVGRRPTLWLRSWREKDACLHTVSGIQSVSSFLIPS